MAHEEPFYVASITSNSLRDPCLITLGIPVPPSGIYIYRSSRCHCMKVEKVTKPKDSQGTCTNFNVAADVLHVHETDRKKVTWA